MPVVLVLALGLLIPLLVGADSEEAVVRQVLDGDSVILADQRQVRLIGINAPELGKHDQPDEPLAVAARDRLRQLVAGQRVRVVLEDEQRDHYGRWLAHLQLPDGRRVEEILVQEGLAAAIAIPPNVAQQHRLFAAESVARGARRGLWGNAYSTPVAADTLDASRTGFRFVQGRITHVGRSQKYLYLDMSPKFALRISHADWAQYFHGKPDDWRGKQIVARGWVSEQNGRLSMRIGHPAMLRPAP